MYIYYSKKLREKKEVSIRQVIACPKNGVGRDTMVGAPDNVKIS